MDKNELTALRAEYLSKNKDTIAYILKDLDYVLKTKVLSGDTEVVISRGDVYRCLRNYKNFKERETKVAYNDLFSKFGISVDYKDILRRYESKLESSGIKVFRNTMTDLNFTYNGYSSLSEITEEMVNNRGIMYLTVIIDTEKEPI
jgi:hypothetical protein